MRKKWSWAASSFMFVDETPHEKISETCANAGFSAVEAKTDFVVSKTEDELEEVKFLYEKYGLSLASFHLPFGPKDDIASFYETDRRAVVENMLRIFDKAAVLGSGVLVMHPSTNRFSPADEGLDRFLSAMGKSLDALLPHAESLGLTLAIENMPPGRLGSDPEHFSLLDEKFAHPALGFCLDTGHAQMSGGAKGPAELFDAMSSRLVSFHLHDNAGYSDLHLAPGHGLVDWKCVFGRMAKAGFENSVCIEAPPFSWGPNKSQSPDSWKALIQETDTLAEKAKR